MSITLSRLILAAFVVAALLAALGLAVASTTSPGPAHHVAQMSMAVLD